MENTGLRSSAHDSCNYWSLLSKVTGQKQSVPGTLTSSGFFAPPRSVSSVKVSFESNTPFMRCERVFEPLIPDVALVELPPQNEDLDS